MAYQSYTIAALSEIPPLVADFAPGNGWTVTGSSDAPVLTRSGGGMSFQLTYNASHVLIWTETGGSVATTSARIRSPMLNGSISTPTVSMPTKVHLFASADPEPFLSIVIEYGINSYRHLYLGNMVKMGSYSGGEVISGAQPNASSDRYAYPMTFMDAQYLFAGNRRSTGSLDVRGGVRVIHSDNPIPWRRFYGPAYPYFDQNDSTFAVGGFGDDINDGALVRGSSPFNGVYVLTPINLYISLADASSTNFAPIGYPAGVRLVNMANLAPGAEVTIGGITWKCFPVFSIDNWYIYKSSGWAANESSYNVGYAYPKVT